MIENRGDEPLDAVVSATGVPTVPDPAGGNGFKIERAYYTPNGDVVDIKTDGPERPLRRRAHRDRRYRPRAATSWSSTRSRPASRSRIPTSRRAATPTPTTGSPSSGTVDAHRSAGRPLRRGARPRTTATRSSSASPTRCAPSRRAPSPSRRRPCRGHVPAGAQRAHRHRHGRGGRADAVGAHALG